MYELTKEEAQRYNRCPLFRKACSHGYEIGLTKEEMLSNLVMLLLNIKDDEDKRRLDEIQMSTEPVFNVFKMGQTKFFN